MILIKGKREQINTIDDCLKVISYYLGLEFANKVAELSNTKSTATKIDIDNIVWALREMREAIGDLDRGLSGIESIFEEERL